jgi:hypothetical protein
MAYGVNAPFGLKPLETLVGATWTGKVNKYKIYADATGTVTYQNSIFENDPVTNATSLGGTAANGKVGGIATYAPTFTDGTPSTFSALPIKGVFVGCEYKSTSNSFDKYKLSNCWIGGTHVAPGSEIIAHIIDDPTVVYEIQVSSHINANANAFVGNPIFPNTNATGGAPFALAGAAGRNFALNVGGGTNFNTVESPFGGTYANNPTTGSTLTGLSAFYLDVDTSTVAGYNNHDYNKNVTTLPLKVLGFSDNVKNIAAPGLTLETTPFVNVRVILNNLANANGAVAPIYVA